MKKKLLGLLIVLCLVVVMIPVLTSADSEPETVKFLIPSSVEVNRGSTVYLLSTTAGGVTKTGATEDNYNIKIVYNNGETPVIYLRGAYVYGTYGAIRTNDGAVDPSQIASKTTIVVEKELGNATSFVPDGITADSYLGHCINWKTGNLEIQGPGKLKMDSAGGGILTASGTTLTTTNADIDVAVTGTGKALSTTGATFNGGKVVLQSETGHGFLSWASETNRGITVNGADVTIRTTATGSEDINPIQIHNSPNAFVTVNSGRLCLESSSTKPALRTNTENGFVINGGVVEMRSLSSVGNSGLVPVLTNYKNAVNENNYFAYNTVGGNAYPAGASLHNYTYFKVIPAYNVTADGATASATKVAEGATVTLTPTTPTGKTLIGWTSSDVTVAEDNTFVMPAKNVSVTANFAFRTTIKLAGTDYTFTDVAPVYLKTATDGVVSEGTETDYNVKLAYDSNNVPTVYLKGATVTSSGTALSGTNFAIVTESASKIAQTGSTADNSAGIVASGKVTFSGAGRLTVEGVENAVYGSGAEIELNDANVKFNKVSGSTWGDAAFAGTITNLTVNGGTVDIESSYMGFYCAPAVVVNDDAIVNINAKGSVVVWGGATFTVNSGYLKAYANSAGYSVFNGVTNVTVNGGTLEAYNAKPGTTTPCVLAAEPTLYSGSYAVTGSSRETAVAYTSGNLTDQFFKVGKAYTVTVIDGADSYDIKAFVGDTVTLNPNVPSGLTLAGWDVTAGGVTVNGASFIMPANDVALKAVYGVAGSITIGSTEYTAIKGGAAIYFKTDDNGVVTVAGDENDYNLKFVYADEEGAVPTLYLKGAKVDAAIKSNAFSVGTTKIVTETDSTVTGAITWSTGKLVISGSGKLALTKTITTTGANLVFKDANVELKTGTSVGINGQNITFDGGKFVFEATHALISDWKDTDPNVYTILVKNNANVSVTSENSTLVMPYATSASTLTVDSGYLKLASIGINDGTSATDGYGQTLRIKNTAIKIKGGIVEFAGSTSLIYGCTPVLNLTEYTNYCASYSSSEDGTNLKAFESDTITGYYQNSYAIKYIKIGPSYTITVNGATASHAKASVGDVITLTPERRAGYKLGSWTVDDGSATVTIENNKFVMPEGNVSITANYVEDPNADAEPDEVIFKFAGTKVTVVRGETYYLITDASGVATQDGANEDNYNIKIEYERIKDKTPVIYLRGAYIKGSYGSIINNDYGSLCTDNERASKVTIVVEKELGNAVSAVPAEVTADSYLVSYIFLSKGGVEVQGPGKLVMDDTTVKENGADKVISAKIQTTGDLTFKNADVQILNGALKGANITFDGGKVDITADDEVIVSIWQNPYTVLVTNDADVTFTSNNKAAMHIVGTDAAKAALQIDSGSLVLKSNATGTNSENAALKMAKADLKINGGTMELIGSVAVVTGNIDMTLNGTFDAICANNTAGTGAVAYKDTTIKQYNSSWQLKYFKIQPGTGSSDDNTGSDSGSTTHKHSTTKVRGKAASCTADGVKEHYKCSCGKFFEDKAAKKEIKDIDTWKVIKATGHKDADKDGICETCKKSAQTSDSSFTALWITLLTVSAMGMCVTFVYNKKKATK